MTATLLEGKPIAEKIKLNVAQRASAFAQATGREPKLLALQVGENPASKLYTNMQARAAESVGVAYELRHFHEDITQEELIVEIQKVNEDTTVDGLILQMPLPETMDSRAVQRAICPKKDAEGITLSNLGQMFFDGLGIVLCTPSSVMTLLEATGEDLTGKQAVVIGHSDIVGKPIALLLLQSPTAAPTVTVCHIATVDLESHVRGADILITAAGVPQGRYRRWVADGKAGPLNLDPLIPGDWIKPDAIVIDVATNRVPAELDKNGMPVLHTDGHTKFHTIGDVDFEGAKERAAFITPVPGGVGPITVAKLLENTIRCAEANGNA